MKILIVCFAVVFALLSGCAATPVAVSEAKYVPLLDTASPSLSQPASNKAQITIVRGESAGFVFCGAVLSLGNKPFADIGSSQKSVFYLARGHYAVYAELGENSPCAVTRYTWDLDVSDTTPEVWNLLFQEGVMNISPANNEAKYGR